MARGQTLFSAYKARKRTGKWSDADISQAILDMERWSQTLPFGFVGWDLARILANDVAVANGADTPITYNYASFDSEGFTKATLNTTTAVIVPPGYGGWYDMQAGTRFTANIAGTVFLTIQLTRNGVASGIGMEELQSGQSRGTVDAKYLLKPNDVLKVLTVNRSGAAVTPIASVAVTNTPLYPWFRGQRVSYPSKLLNS